MRKKITYIFSAAFLLIMLTPIIYVSRLQALNGVSLQQIVYTDYFEVSGVIEQDTSVSIVLGYPVYIKDVYVQKNSYVNKGQLLFTLDKEKMQKAIENNYSADKSGTVASARLTATLPEGETIYDIPSEIYASENGNISSLNVYNGAVAMQGNPLCTISQNDKTILKLTVNQDDYSRISVGDELQVSLSIAPERIYDAIIINRCAVVRKESTAFGIKTVLDIFAQITNPDDYIVQGVQFRGRIIKAPKEKVNFLPYEFVYQDDGGEYVSVFQNGLAEKIYIKTGQEFEKGIEVLTSFSENAVFLQEDNIKKDKILLLDDNK